MTTRVLVLDQGYQPHRIVSWQCAITMLFRNVAEVIEEYDEDVRAVTFVMKMPAVIRLLKRIARRRAVRFSRMNVLLRDNFTCQYCGHKFPTRQLNYDHVLPRSQGGKTCWENIVASCFECNHRKAGRTPEQARMHLLKRPERPKTLPLMAFHVEDGDALPDIWASYLYWHGRLEES
jgi:5-methylcytosine-specific restriction endonuclease McrA